MGWNIGGVLGIVLGGIITTFIGWRYIFYINVPVGLIGFALGLKYIRDNRRTETKIDYAGTVLLVLLLSLISYGAVEIAGNGVKASYIAMVLVGLVLLVPFVLIERRVRDPPVISMSAFREKLLSLSLTAATLQAVGFLSVLFLIIMYLQGIRGHDPPLDASLLLVPGYVVSSLLAPRMGAPLRQGRTQAHRWHRHSTHGSGRPRLPADGGQHIDIHCCPGLDCYRDRRCNVLAL